MYQLLILKCVIIITFAETSEIIELTSLSSHSIITSRNKSLLLNCASYSTSNSALTTTAVTWRHQGYHIPIDDDLKQTLSNGSLLIKRVSLPKKKRIHLQSSTSKRAADDGNYTCLLHNSVGAFSAKPINVIVTRFPQSFSVEPKSETATVGSSVRLKCQIESILPIYYVWFHNGNEIPHGEYPYQRHIQLQLLGSLQISNVSHSDSGIYQCMARTGTGTSMGDLFIDLEEHTLKSSNATLTITDAHFDNSHPESFEFLTESSDIIAKPKESVTFECFLNHYNPHVNWYRKSGKSIPSYKRSRIVGSANLVINDLKYDDEDIYVCNASMNNRMITQENILTIHVPPEFKSRPQSKVKPAAQTARFHCSSDGVPPPTIKWYKNGDEININGRIKMKNEKANSLIISQLVVSDSGIYQCIAENSAGISISNAYLIVNSSNSRPEPPRDVRAKVLSSTSMSLTWNQSLSPSGLNIQAYTVHYLPSSGGIEFQKVAVNTSQLIDKLEPYTNYTFYVRAYNGRSASEQSNPITQMTDEDIPIGVPIAKLTPLSSTVLNISWDELSPKISRGIITGHRIHYRRHDQASYNVQELPNYVRHCVIEGLLPKHKYDVRIMCRTKFGYPILSDIEWPWQSCVMPNHKNETQNHLSIKTIVHLTALNSTTIEVRWDLLTPNENIHIDGFRLYYEESDELKGPINLNADKRKCILKDLKPHTWYRVDLIAYNSSGDGIRSSQNIMTLPLPLQKNSVQNQQNNLQSVENVHIKSPLGLEATPLSSTVIKLVWNALENNDIVYYSVRYLSLLHVNVQNNTFEYNYIRSTNNEVIITNLLPFTLYEFSVRAHDIRNNNGPFSPKIECKTLEDVPSSPEDLTVMIVDSHSIRLNWQRPKLPNGIITSYIALFNTKFIENFELWYRKEENGSKLTTVIQNLSSNTQYYFCIRAATNAGLGQISKCIATKIPIRIINSTNRNNHIVNAQNDIIKVSYPIFGIIIGLSIGIFCIIICATIIIFRNRCCHSNTNNLHECSNGHSVHFRNGHLLSMYGDVSQTNDKRRSPDGEYKEMDSFVSSRNMITEDVNDYHIDTKGGYLPLNRNDSLKQNGIEVKSPKKRYDLTDIIDKNSSSLLRELRNNGKLEVNGSETFPLTKTQQITPQSQLELRSFVENCAPGRPKEGTVVLHEAQ